MKCLATCLNVLAVFALYLSHLFISAETVEAKVFFVATTGNDAHQGSKTQPFLTIERGLRALQAGDTLFIRAGTYPEEINSRVQVIPTGTSWSDAPLVSAYPGEEVVLRPHERAAVITLMHPNIHYVRFNRLVLDASALGGSLSNVYGHLYGILGTNGAHHIRFTNIEVKNAAGSGVLIMSNGADTATAFEFIGCEVHHNGVNADGHGFDLRSGGNLVQRCKVHDNGGDGILSYSDDSLVPVDGNTINANDVYGNSTMSGSASGIRIDIDSGTGNVVRNNVVRGNKNGILVGNPFVVGSAVSATKIYNNTIYANTPGIAIVIFANSASADVKNNIIYKNGGIILNAGSETTRSNNLFTDPEFVDESHGNFRL